MELLKGVLREDGGQDLIEYSLLIAFVSFVSVALMLGAGKSLAGMWSVSNSQLVVANTSAS